MNELPPGWRLATIKDVAETGSGGTPLRKQAAYFGGSVLWYKSGELNDSAVALHSEETLTEEGLQSSSAKLFPAKSVLVAMYGATAGKIGILPAAATTNQAVCGITASRYVDHKYLFFFLLSKRTDLLSKRIGGAQPNINQQVIRDLAIPIPPLAEQRRIVAEIEKQFTRLDAANHSVSEIQKRLHKYLNSALPRLCALPQDLALDGRAGLPAGWKWLKVAEVGEVKLGRQRSPEHHIGQHMRPYLRVANVFEDRIDTRSILEMNFTPGEFETFSLKPGDILLNEGQSKELVGRAAIYRDEVPGACFQNTLLRFRPHDTLTPDFALLVFRAYLRTGRFQKAAKWTTNIAHLGANRFAEMYFPLPDSPSQREIVEKADRDLTLLTNLKIEILRAERRAARLRQAILAKAFSGQLVPQDPNDEPASLLPDRIRAERAASTPRHPTRTPRKPATAKSNAWPTVAHDAARR